MAPSDSARIRDIGAARPHPGCMAAHSQALSIETSAGKHLGLLNSGTVKILDFGLSRFVHQPALHGPAQNHGQRCPTCSGAACRRVGRLSRGYLGLGVVL